MISLHAMAAAWTQTPEWELDDGEAKTLALAIKDVERHYPLPIRKDYAALGALFTAMFVVYRGKIKKIAARKAADAARGDGTPPPSPNPAPFAMPLNAGAAQPADGSAWWNPPDGSPAN